MFITDASQAFQKPYRRGNVAAFTLNWFDDDRRDFFRRSSCFEKKILDPVERAFRRPAAAAHFGRERIAVLVRIRYVYYVERLALKAGPLRGFRRRERKRSQRAAMKASEERNELLASRRVHRHFQRALDG